MIAAAEFTRPADMPLLDRLAHLGVPLADLTADSRNVKLGSIFVAYPGSVQDGRAYIAEAIARGASAVIWEKSGFRWNEASEVPNLGIENLRGRISEIAGHIYGNPSDSMWMAGVTGTNGKTSVSQWIAAALDRTGRRSAVLGTLGNGLVGERAEAKNTTPDPIVLQRLLADYLRRGARHVAMEVSSHGLDQGRVSGIKYDAAVFTNLTRDHLDYHGTMEAYGEAKAKLLEARGVKHRIVNVDDEFGAALAKRYAGVVTYGTQAAGNRQQAAGNRQQAAGKPTLLASNIALSDAGVRFHLDSDWGRGEVRAGVLGAFNVSNLLAVLATLLAAGLTFDEAVAAVGTLDPVPGRLERVGGGALPLVVVDYAHTPDALEKALEALRPAVAAGHRLFCVFGCGGDRDPGKRPLMAAAASRLADHVIVTSDNPRSESPAAIIAQVMAGVRGNAEAIEDRQVAIFSAVHHATPGDVVLLAGKGHETYQEIAGVRHPFDDREVARAALAEWRGASR